MENELVNINIFDYEINQLNNQLAYCKTCKKNFNINLIEGHIRWEKENNRNKIDNNSEDALKNTKTN